MSAAAATAADVSVGALTLSVGGKRLQGLRLTQALTDAQLERTTDGASTLTLHVHDPKRTLLTSGVLSEPGVDLTLDKHAWRLVQVNKQGSDLDLTFEDRVVALLRAKKGAKNVARAKMTRAEFALSLVREIKPAVRFVCPQLHKLQLVSGRADTRTLRRQLPYQFRRGGIDNGANENSWDALQRLAQEVNWRCFANEGAIWFVSDDDLLAAPPAMRVSETTIGVDNVDFDIDRGKVHDEATLTARVARWSADPGSVVVLYELGPADGSWLVHTTQRSLFEPTTEITLRRYSKPKLEPTASTAAITGAGSRAAGSATTAYPGDSRGSKVRLAYEAAISIDQKRYPYVWGGGHGAAGVPSGSPPGYDCSGSVCAVLAAAGLGFRAHGPVSVSGALENWGAAGRGEGLTVYANGEHTFMVFHTAAGDRHFGTGDWGKGWGGAGFNPNLHPTSGFVARHWPGT